MGELGATYWSGPLEVFFQKPGPTQSAIKAHFGTKRQRRVEVDGARAPFAQGTRRRSA